MLLNLDSICSIQSYFISNIDSLLGAVSEKQSSSVQMNVTDTMPSTA